MVRFLWISSLTLQECLEKYYNSNNGYGKRYSRFIDSLVTNKSREDFRGRVYKEVTGKYLGKSPFTQFAKTNYGYPSEDQVQQFTEMLFLEKLNYKDN